MNTDIIPLVKNVVIVFTILIVVFIIIAFSYAKIKALITGKKPQKTGPELYAAQMAMLKNPDKKTKVRKAKIPDVDRSKVNIDSSQQAQQQQAQQQQYQQQYQQPGQAAPQSSDPMVPPVRRDIENRRIRTQSRIQMPVVQQDLPKRNLFEVVNNQQASYRGMQVGSISYTPQANQQQNQQANLRDQSLNWGGGTGSRKANISFK
ncbi:MAG: hypothetical protein LC102_06900 [Ignavibacteriales bacterium]|nr:MAG: hypothetical protein F9K26_10950 [Ignavibacteriaceae bacterium]MBW7874037.1 hypothetical protein [Ignavibacteria bacterium]MCZ2143137.1 hypothetical protein [Ignavibacteriales bacterium]OQY74008.1 MAG: hypothetical protein B6D45_07380 [Ignavibacteriales bacterium UTCHB3]MBV6444017.1 hypothetical protein [Ignavibacteriaceae bacterium]